MYLCQSVLQFFKKSNCICRENKKVSEDGLVCKTEAYQPADLSNTNENQSKLFEKPEDHRVLQTMISEIASSSHALTPFEEEHRSLSALIETNDAFHLQSQLEKSDINNYIDSEGFSLLHKAVFSGNLKTISLLLPRLSNMNLKDDNGRTALHYACLQQKLEIADFLIEAGCDLDISDNYGKLPIDYLEDPTMLKSFSDMRSPNSLFSITEANDETLTWMMKDLRHKSQKYLIKNFEVIRNIGVGSFGKVFLVRNLENGKFFAMKVMNKDMISEKGMIGYVLSEKNLLSKLIHPFIVPLISSFQINTHLMLVLPYCPDTLQDRLKKKIPKRIVRLYTCELVLAIGYLHSQSIIYRDLKPSNVLINEDGHLMLADFGLAKETSFMRTSSFCGSFGYLAPEIEEKKQYGKDVDWYMLGLVLFEMITGKMFFEEPSRIAAVSGDARDLIEGLLKKEPDQRIGFDNDVEQVKQHKFFDGVSWERVFNKQTNLFEQFSLKSADFTKSDKIMSLSFINE
jgi:protein-serine/threonine kinase